MPCHSKATDTAQTAQAPERYPVNRNSAYHAHIYFDEHRVEFATELCRITAETFAIPMGQVHQRLVGPHPMWSCQLSFTSAQFAAVVPFLDEHRQELTVLVHGVTGDDLIDHTEHAYWLGTPQTLNLQMFTT